MTKNIFWLIIVVLAILIGLYPATYFFIDGKFGLLSSKSNDLLNNPFWNIGFYIHIVLGGLALLIGWAQFSTKLRRNNLNLHRQIGKVYVVSVLLSSLAGFYIAFSASGGITASVGFICLAIIWFYSTLVAYISIKNKKVKQHQTMMIYSYAACFAAVTLRVWLPLLILLFGDFVIAYNIVAWLCWVPNLIVANLIIKRIVIQKI